MDADEGICDGVFDVDREDDVDDPEKEDAECEEIDSVDDGVVKMTVLWQVAERRIIIRMRRSRLEQ